MTGGVAYGPALAMDVLANMQVGGNSGTSENTYVACRFRAGQSSTLVSFRTYWLRAPNPGYAEGTGGINVVTLQTDSDGLPSGTVLASVTVTNPASPHPVVAFPVPAQVVAGTRYHLVFVNTDPNPRVNFNGLDFAFVYTPTTPRQPRFLDDDLAALRSTLNPTTPWSVQEQYTPIIDLTYGNGAHQGQGYRWADTTNDRNISGDVMLRERFTVTGNARIVTGAALRCALTSGAGNLTVRLEDGAGVPVDSFTIPASSIPAMSIDDWPAGQWVSGAFSQPRVLQVGETYSLRFSADAGTTIWTRYIWDGSDEGYHPATVFTDGTAERSTNSGGSWTWTAPSSATVGVEADWQCYLTTAEGCTTMTAETYANGVKVGTRTVSVADPTAEESNEVVIDAGIAADLAVMAAIIAQTNAELKTDPSQEIKDLARAVRRLDRKVARLLDSVD